MKRLLALLALCSLAAALSADTNNMKDEQKKTKYICAIGGPVRPITTEFATREECEANCLQPGAIAYCEETPISTEVNGDEID